MSSRMSSLPQVVAQQRLTIRRESESPPLTPIFGPRFVVIETVEFGATLKADLPPLVFQDDNALQAMPARLAILRTIRRTFSGFSVAVHSVHSFSKTFSMYARIGK